MKVNVFISKLKHDDMDRPLYFHWSDLDNRKETTKQSRRTKTTKSN